MTMKLAAISSLIALALAASACTTSRPKPDMDGILQFSGTVAAIDESCHFDGVCTATVNGIVVTTMSGERLGAPVWGEPNSLPAIGQRVEVRCLSTGPRSCTLKGDRRHYLRVLP